MTVEAAGFEPAFETYKETVLPIELCPLKRHIAGIGPLPIPATIISQIKTRNKII